MEVVLVLSMTMQISVFATALTDYVIFPSWTISFKDSESLASLITKLAGSPENVYTSQRADRPTPSFWIASLDDSALNTLQAQPESIVRGVQVDETMAVLENVVPSDLYATLSGAGAHATQIAAADELRVISQPPGSAGIARYPNYVYQPGQPKTEMYIYHVEMGIDINHKDFQDRQGGIDGIEWVWTKRAIATGVDTRTESLSARGHSTCTASKAAGHQYGASKNMHLVVVKFPNLKVGSLTEAIPAVLEHARRNKRQKRGVVSISWSSGKPVDPSNPGLGWSEILRDLQELISEMGFIVICPAGNHGQETDPATGSKRSLIDTAPAIWASTEHSREPAVPNLVAVGNVEASGLHYPTSQRFPADKLIHAPGTSIKCASSYTKSGYKVFTGTSFSAPLVAGVVAELLGFGLVMLPGRADKLTSDILISQASWGPRTRKRHSYDPDPVLNIIWNGVSEVENPRHLSMGNLSLLYAMDSNGSDTPIAVA